MIEYTSYGEGELVVHFAPLVLESFCKHVQANIRNPEACGILVGSTSVDFKEIWVDSATTPLPQDCRGRTYFFLKDKGHQNFVNCVFDESGGTQRLLGTWHTHPEKTPKPSSDDCRGWNKMIKKNPDFSRLIFVIVGTSDIRLFTKKGKDFIELAARNRHE